MVFAVTHTSGPYCRDTNLQARKESEWRCFWGNRWGESNRGTEECGACVAWLGFVQKAVGACRAKAG